MNRDGDPEKPWGKGDPPAEVQASDSGAEDVRSSARGDVGVTGWALRMLGPVPGQAKGC